MPLNLSYFALRRLALDLGARVERRRILDAAIVAPNTLALDVAAADELSDDVPVSRVILSASRTRGRVTLEESDGPLEGERPGWIERYLEKAQITALTQLPQERTLVLDIVRRDRVGGVFHTQLIAEVMGRNSNVLLVSDKDRILAVLRPQNTETRTLQTGRPYTPLSAQPAPPPDQLTPEALLAVIQAGDRGPVPALSRAVAGLDPLTAAEALHRAGLPEGPTSPEEAERLIDLLRQFYTAPPFADHVSLVAGPRGGITPFTITHRPEEDVTAYETVTLAIHAELDRTREDQAAKGHAKELARTVDRALKAARTKRKRITADLEDAREADRYEKWGSLIMAQLDAIPEGSSEATLDDLFETGEPVTIPLNARRTAVENGESYIRQASKRRKSEPVLKRRLEAVRTEIESLEGYRQKIESVTDENDLEPVRDELIAAGLIRPQKRKQRPSRSQGGEDGLRPRRYRTTDGWEVWVGRTDRENDALTKSSPKTDIWMHAHGCPGSHVVLKRKTPNSEPTAVALEEAASLAAYWSKARGAKTVPVNYTEVRYVRKPRGAPPGLVTIQNEKTVFVRPMEISKVDEV